MIDCFFTLLGKPGADSVREILCPGCWMVLQKVRE
jgi:hypothetical protein